MTQQERIYSGRKGEPVNVRCMVGDLFSNVLISVNGSHGTVVDYNPIYSGKEGFLVVTDSKGKALFLTE